MHDTNIFIPTDHSDIALTQLNCINAVRIICKLTQSIQQHRGASIACINGDASFYPLTQKLRSNINRLFQILERFDGVNQKPKLDNIPSLIEDWRAIEADWRQDTVIHNYEFHCHLLEKLNMYSRRCINDWVITPASQQENDELFQHVKTALFEIPAQIERLGRLRGLCIHTIVSNHCDNDCRIRISFLNKMIRSESPNLYSALKGFNNSKAKDHAELISKKDFKVNSLINSIERDILNVRTIRLDANIFFKKITTLMDIYWAGVERGIQVIEDDLLQLYLDA